jgi:hypothetical protein
MVNMSVRQFFQTRSYVLINSDIIKGVIEDTLHKGMDCFPGVSFTKHSQVAFTVNFTGPFKFDANSIPNYREKQNSYISDMPNDVFAIIAGLSVISVAQAFEIRTVSIYIYMPCISLIRLGRQTKRKDAIFKSVVKVYFP